MTLGYISSVTSATRGRGSSGSTRTWPSLTLSISLQLTRAAACSRARAAYMKASLSVRGCSSLVQQPVQTAVVHSRRWLVEQKHRGRGRHGDFQRPLLGIAEPLLEVARAA